MGMLIVFWFVEDTLPHDFLRFGGWTEPALLGLAWVDGISRRLEGVRTLEAKVHDCSQLEGMTSPKSFR